MLDNPYIILEYPYVALFFWIEYKSKILFKNLSIAVFGPKV